MIRVTTVPLTKRMQDLVESAEDIAEEWGNEFFGVEHFVEAIRRSNEDTRNRFTNLGVTLSELPISTE